ncbi:P-loop containing nucleoside triphosphate hydrolase protein, partial [Auriculariales sp. MPI-PUGE-AT-0066]
MVRADMETQRLRFEPEAAVLEQFRRLLSTKSGRHDNDFVDFKEIAILPTADEIACAKPAHLLTALALGDVPKDQRPEMVLDNQFRLLREDMIHELREALQNHAKSKEKGGKGKSPLGFEIAGLKLHGVSGSSGSASNGYQDRLTRFLQGCQAEDRLQFLKDNKGIIKHRSLACLAVDDKAIAFGEINRNEDLLACKLPIVVLQVSGETNTVDVLSKLKKGRPVKLIQVDTAVFAYEPVLTVLQRMSRPELSPELFLWDNDPLQAPQSMPDPFSNSLLAALSQRVSLIQGPPGTGKSFVGALSAKVLLEQTSLKILVCCYTNHALDQFMEDLLDNKIPPQLMVRLGSKSTVRTAPLLLSKQPPVSNLDSQHWIGIDAARSDAMTRWDVFDKAFTVFNNKRIPYAEILAHLEFDEQDYFAAFTVPPDALNTVGRKGKTIDEFYLIQQWQRGWDAGVLKKNRSLQAPNVVPIWQMRNPARQAKYQEWKEALEMERIRGVYDLGMRYNQSVDELQARFGAKNGAILKSKRIIGCTTTAAAMYTNSLREACADVLLIEEAGEILEPHVLTALGQNIKQMILIGDHQQLRPKVNNYALTVEKGNGFELNNLVDADGTRGRPNLRGITDNVVFITHLHPEDELEGVAEARDCGAKSSKQNTFEVQMVLKIIKYLAQQGYSTDEVAVLTPYLGQLSKLRDALSKDSDPYLSEMDRVDLVRAGLSHAAAKSNNKPLRLSTIDNAQGEEWNIVIISLTRSNSRNDIGFMFSPERLNVLLSRARNACIIIGNTDTFRNSRKGGDLWTKLFDFMSNKGNIYNGLPVRCERHPVRLGYSANLKTLTKVAGWWMPTACGVLLSCGQHQCPSKCHWISDHSKMACEIKLTYICQFGHKKLYMCSNGPPQTCSECEKEAKEEKERIKRRQEEQERRDSEQKVHEKELQTVQAQIEAERLAQRDARAREEMENVARLKREELEQERERSSRAAAAKAAALKTHVKPSPPSVPLPPVRAASPIATLAGIRPPGVSGQATTSPVTPVADTTSPTLPQSASATNSDIGALHSGKRSRPFATVRQAEHALATASAVPGCDYEAAKNKHIDALMAMTGLESVKEQVLTIRDRIELATRQNTSLKDERFNISLLGNPGTGKTTVARLYAKFLASIDLLPGDAFVETTGSLLSSDGIPGTKKHIDHILAQGGGAMFIDECYQLVSPKYSGGRQVLDFLLAEMENNVGKMIFIVAGYTKEMEDFFEHNPGENDTLAPTTLAKPSPGIPSRVPHTLRFEDYTDQELLHMFQTYVNKSDLAVDAAGMASETLAPCRICSSALQTASQSEFTLTYRWHVRRRYALHQGRPDGPDPSTAVTTSEAWSKLKKMIGLNSVKQSVEDLIDLISTNYKRELQEKEPLQVTLNRVFYGNPGTGKTTVAKIYGQILADIGMLSKGEVVMKNPSDFKGQHIGASEAQTKDILKSTVGKVLVIDEAYMLYKGGGSDDLRQPTSSPLPSLTRSSPKFTMSQGTIAAYFCLATNAMQDMFQDFSDAELLQILDLKMGQQDMSATTRQEGCNRCPWPLPLAVTSATALPTSQRSHDAILEPVDIDANFNRVENSAAALAKLFEDVVDADKIVKKLEGYQTLLVVSGLWARSHVMRRNLSQPASCSRALLVRTGKTTTARKMGQVFCDMGMLSSGDVVESSASDLVGQYVGHTGPKTKKLFEKALGKIVVILAGYTKDIDRLMTVNSGLSSRFPEEITFDNIAPEK